VSGPSWLVLGESYSSGWRAWCRDTLGHERPLGASVPIDGYANGWRINSTCESARIAFAGQGAADVAYVISAIGAMLLIALALPLKLPQRIRHQVRLTGRRRGAPLPAAETRTAPAGRLVDRPPIVLAPKAALAWGVGVGVLAGFAFEVRVGVVAAELTGLLLLAGISPRRLTWLALLGMVAIPLLYLARPAHNFGGFSFYFAQHQMLAHWIATGVVCALLVAAVLQSRELRDARGPGARRLSRERDASEDAHETSSRLGSYV
jgi:hypothetical protein